MRNGESELEQAVDVKLREAIADLRKRTKQRDIENMCLAARSLVFSAEIAKYSYAWTPGIQKQARECFRRALEKIREHCTSGHPHARIARMTHRHVAQRMQRLFPRASLSQKRKGRGKGRGRGGRRTSID